MQQLRTRFNFRVQFVLAMLCMTLALTACGGAAGGESGEQTDAGTTVALEGNATRGAELFTQNTGGAPACSACHSTTTQMIVGPGFEGYADVAGTRVEGQSAETYTHDSILRPASFIVSGFSNSMYNQYERALTDQDVADLTAYLLTL